MEQTMVEQMENEVQTTGVEINEVGTDEGFSFKGFKDVKSLQNAYSSLESEFTKRSQKLKELTGERDSLISKLEQIEKSQQEIKQSSAGKNLDEFIKLNPKAEKIRAHLEEFSLNFQDENFTGDFYQAYIDVLERQLDENIANLNSQEFLLSQIEGTAIKDKIIRDYLANINNSNKNMPLISGGGKFALAPPKKPKSFQEAGEIAKTIIKKI